MKFHLSGLAFIIADMPAPDPHIDYPQLDTKIQDWAQELGFQQAGVTDIDLTEHEQHLQAWVAKGFHGDMHYMTKHGSKRTHPDELVSGTVRVISVRMNYFPPDIEDCEQVLQDSNKAYISRYTLGRDYHKLMRKRLKKLAEKIQSEIGEFGYRVFTDSAPVMEKGLASNAGLGWIGKHTNLINRDAGSWFFLGEIYTDLPLTVTAQRSENHCGDCSACIDICPTQAIVAPYQLDARRCISYLTIELRDSIPVEFRAAIGNRIYGCDDCQLVCPWNRFAKITEEKDFHARHPLDAPDLLDLFAWDENQFLSEMEGSAIRRIGFDCWQRNIAIALGNVTCDPLMQDAIVSALNEKLDSASGMVAEHIRWALDCYED